MFDHQNDNSSLVIVAEMKRRRASVELNTTRKRSFYVEDVWRFRAKRREQSKFVEMLKH